MTKSAEVPVAPPDPHVGDASYLNVDEAEYSELRFYAFRNCVIGALRGFGTVGPMGDSVLEGGRVAEGPLECVDPTFYVVDDRWNEYQIVVVVETAPENLSKDLIRRLSELLGGWPDWAVLIRLYRGSDLVSAVTLQAHRVMVEGPLLRSCASVEEIVAACSGS